MTEDFNKKFLTERDKTGRFIVKSLRTGKVYYVEPIDNNTRSNWGDLDPVTKKMTGDYGNKYKGSIKPEESMITEENGFDKIHYISAGESPLSYIQKIDDMYYNQMNK